MRSGSPKASRWGRVSVVTDRRGQLQRALADVQLRISQACVAAGRHPDEVTLIAVTKTWPLSDVRLLADLGVRHVGESRAAELAEKQAAAADLDLTWHAIGQIQSNKAKVIARHADVVHAVDRLSVVEALGRACTSLQRDLDVLIQISVDPRPSPQRGGAAASDVPALADAIARQPRLQLAGVMAVAPLDEDPDTAFALLARVHADLLRDHPHAQIRSAGMSEDLEAAIRHGATHVRVGSAILGNRPDLH